MSDYTVVLPTVGRPSLREVLTDLLGQDGPAPARIVLVDDRPLDRTEPLDLPDGAVPVDVLRSGGRGPAAARNAGWRAATTEWVAFLDDDVRLPAGWATRLAADLAAAGPRVGATQGRITVPLPEHRRPTDWERNTAGLETALWATADMAYRRAALAAVHGFDERFPRAYREDADLALRVTQAGWELVRGEREILHPVRPADDAVSLRMQAGSASDSLMRALHGPTWREIGGTGRGRFRWHVATVAAGSAAALLAVAGRHRAATVAAATWAGLTADFAARRIAPGPRPGEEGWAAEWRRMAWTSVAIPWSAVWHRLHGAVRFRDVSAWPPPVRAALLDRDGTIVEDVPYNGDPAKVRTVAGAAESLRRLRAGGLLIGMVTNQSGVARGLIAAEDVGRVNERVQDLLGSFDVVEHCPHGPEDGCTCRKPGPGMVLRAARALGVEPHECVVVGDIGADVGAARAAGARAVLVPTPVTREEEVEQAEHVAADLSSAVDLVLAMAGEDQ
ncbi:HAD-IIIA family hydrolase [Oceanitalea stevensii]|uniref:D,D-heptose 1,7-bisphosphate phosphatase n=1 Tax=Oceanitalea stevensii TaxID=2763072 RepID=A0ABR8Z174_9MICO|nr:HAD-IIIA family hydrolase [Oceanitalea stevensii]MBD8062063.1 HAD-IIIA family hydrolase [Oceanitalea stevensii]